MPNTNETNVALVARLEAEVAALEGQPADQQGNLSSLRGQLAAARQRVKDHAGEPTSPPGLRSGTPSPTGAFKAEAAAIVTKMDALAQTIRDNSIDNPKLKAAADELAALSARLAVAPGIRE